MEHRARQRDQPVNVPAAGHKPLGILCGFLKRVKQGWQIRVPCLQRGHSCFRQFLQPSQHFLSALEREQVFLQGRESFVDLGNFTVAFSDEFPKALLLGAKVGAFFG
ncbi:hypothetical protein LPB142_11945 [Rhodobacter xanthinilyticus]|uniref:Uncharacterized protein n=1 Tax=Rhodobacter xanthinilyticus TaxID=1850250 RepID=A0A1D9MDU4_9RHOB|nr:hypothetical protein LPB142_11945 [Rhodobacter xanthinilyticus]